MGRMKQMSKMTQQITDNIDAAGTDMMRSYVTDCVEGKISALTQFIDCDDIVGNTLMAYLIAHTEDIVDILINKSFVTK